MKGISLRAPNRSQMSTDPTRSQGDIDNQLLQSGCMQVVYIDTLRWEWCDTGLHTISIRSMTWHTCG